jgi:hypothetical protein
MCESHDLTWQMVALAAQAVLKNRVAAGVEGAVVRLAIEQLPDPATRPGGIHGATGSVPARVAFSPRQFGLNDGICLQSDDWSCWSAPPTRDNSSSTTPSRGPHSTTQPLLA